MGGPISRRHVVVKSALLLALVLLTGILAYTPRSYAISDEYRFFLHRSGCSEKADIDGTCNILLSREENDINRSEKKHTSTLLKQIGKNKINKSNKTIDKLQLTKNLNTDIVGRSLEYAVIFMNSSGWKDLDDSGMEWVYEGFRAHLEKDKWTGVISNITVD